ncbi:hypothetical protein HJFPF1_02727 [Paramyrothecium foliicola]|nr:hypothetical protein HJFPF1_02727 [Paramyrothecium foliicola]
MGRIFLLSWAEDALQGTHGLQCQVDKVQSADPVGPKSDESRSVLAPGCPRGLDDLCLDGFGHTGSCDKGRLGSHEP